MWSSGKHAARRLSSTRHTRVTSRSGGDVTLASYGATAIRASISRLSIITVASGGCAVLGAAPIANETVPRWEAGGVGGVHVSLDRGSHYCG